jgi:hypothetical protein
VGSPTGMLFVFSGVYRTPAPTLDEMTGVSTSVCIERLGRPINAIPPSTFHIALQLQHSRKTGASGIRWRRRQDECLVVLVDDENIPSQCDYTYATVLQ